MIRANEHVAAFLAGRAAARRSTACTSAPIRRRSRGSLAQLADLEVPTPPVPERLSPQQAAELAGAISRRVTEYVEQSGRGREAFPTLVLRALKQARYDPREPRPLGAREPGVLPLHLADPPLPRPRRPPGAPARARRSATTRCPTTSRRSPSTPRRASARRRSSSTSPTTSASPGCSRTRCSSAAGTSRGRARSPARSAPGLFVRFGEVFEGMLPARRLPRRVLRAERDRDGARRPPQRPPLPARRPDRGAGRVDREAARGRSTSPPA